MEKHAYSFHNAKRCIFPLDSGNSEMVSRFPFVEDVGFAALHGEYQFVCLGKFRKANWFAVPLQYRMSAKEPSVWETVAHFEEFTGSEQEEKPQAHSRPEQSICSKPVRLELSFQPPEHFWCDRKPSFRCSPPSLEARQG